MAPKIEYVTGQSWYNHFVSYGETDTMGVLYYAEYLHIYERSRSFFIREHGMSYAEVEQRGIILPVREAQSRYRVPVRFDDEIFIRVGISEWKRASMKFSYEVWNIEKSILHATGMTEHAAVNSQGKPVRIPEWLKELFV
ncbi:thioesterase family protein [Pseudodesulfovibrio sp. zrk46]|uniref:acyl-CoA thioesterase n=1 Tax=Pseudodesulfovibrio sp. zrk46 TaxID=2725288 RepID=UPI001449ED37|nr:thioesterase family protein [Pseudodesulfovibrio sp. zrk46]QJB57623.1 acyl-CoA thioesterase [Pseudodesulfovibrio sp. zrk46]